MPVPKKRRSKSKKRMKTARWKIIVPQLRPCPECKALGRPHFVCSVCGFYKGRPVILTSSATTQSSATETSE
ncbi:50S ribosomal protein L32 [bacterium]|nr:50S ribosomal protein L32 [bacterium]